MTEAGAKPEQSAAGKNFASTHRDAITALYRQSHRHDIGCMTPCSIGNGVAAVRNLEVCQFYM